LAPSHVAVEDGKEPVTPLSMFSTLVSRLAVAHKGSFGMSALFHSHSTQERLGLIVSSTDSSGRAHGPTSTDVVRLFRTKRS
jgi:hypothetical protein